ncbi:hypothetical protein [Brachybacterium sp. UMB0905]|nr:hypothetical protein [Brachybacterium sp. UMB0905]
MTVSDVARTAILERLEDVHDEGELRKAIAEDTGERFSIDDVLADLEQ